MFKLSIITINRNNAVNLEKTILSVLDQTFADFEYIIIDGASTDQSVQVIKNIENKISFWISEPDTGKYNAMNKGILKAKGEYCLFLNSGDFLYNKNTLKEVFASNITEDIISGDVIKYSNKYPLNEIFSMITHSDISFSDLYRFSLNHQATFIKRKLFFEYGLYDERFEVISDWVFTLKTLGVGKATFKYLDKVICYYDNDGISNNNKNYLLKERIPALMELVPSRILKDYQNVFNNMDNLNILNRLKQYPQCWFVIKVMNFLLKKLGK